MKTQEFVELIPDYKKKLVKDGLSASIIGIAKRVTNDFKEYCFNNNIEIINMEVIKKFYFEKYFFDFDNPEKRYYYSLRKVLLSVMEYYNTGQCLKRHNKLSEINVPDKYNALFEFIKKDYVEKLNIVKKSKRRILWITSDMFYFFEKNKINTIESLIINDVISYINSVKSKYSEHSLKTIKNILRLLFNWLNNEKVTTFNGKQIFPIIKKINRNKILSSYSKQEIKLMLESIDNTAKDGKCIYLILSLLVYYGIRVGDLMNLKFENIDFEQNLIRINQRKTQKELVLPLIDEVKFALIDYLKNGRNYSECDSDYILITMHAPFTKFNSDASIHHFITDVMDKANVDYTNKHHGAHSFRHSIATNMINDNIPLSEICSILGHSSTRVTDIYITKNIDKLKELTLEVPYEL